MDRDVLLLATKDTMAYARRPGHEAVATGEQLLATVPADRLPVRVSVEDVLTEPSWDISPASMLTLARRARDAILRDGFAGVVVAHGTDTVEETAYLTDLLAGRRPGAVGSSSPARCDTWTTWAATGRATSPPRSPPLPHRS